MRLLLCWCVLYLQNGGTFALDDSTTQETPTNVTAQLAEGEQKLSEKIIQIMKHFQLADPVGFPGAEIPEPFPVPDMRQSLSLATMYMRNVKMRGLNKFRIVSIEAEIAKMEVKAVMLIDELFVAGDYTMSTWLSRSIGPFTTNLTTITVSGKANLAIERDGKLRAQDISMDISFKSIRVDFKNLGFFASTFQSVVNSIGGFIFDSIKPFILQEAYTKIRSAINENLDKSTGDMQFPNSISPLDMVIADARKKVREMGVDPYKVNDYNTTLGLFSVTLSHTWLTGASSFQRVGNITLRMENNTLIADFEIGTQKLEGQTHWDVTAIGGVMSRAGTASFSVEYLSAQVVLAQPLDTREKPQFRDLQLELGNIQVRCDGAGTLDYVVEFVVNILPNLLRYQIVDAIEGPLLERGQQEFNKLDTQELIMSKLPEVDKMQTFKLSALFATSTPDRVYDEDEFFNF